MTGTEGLMALMPTPERAKARAVGVSHLPHNSSEALWLAALPALTHPQRQEHVAQ